MKIIYVFLVLTVASSLALPILRSLASKKSKYFGAAALSYHITSAGKNYTTTLGEQFSITTPENSMKWEATEPKKGSFDYSQATIVVNFAKEHNILVRGHNLCWGVSNPSWLVNGGFSASELQQLLKAHIDNVVGHFRTTASGTIYSWDVVNEAVSDSPSNGNIFKHNIWYPAIPNYVDLAFQWARQADPSVKLFYNDYGAEGLGAKSEAVYNMVKSMKEKGIPIDGVGFEMHVGLSYYPSPSEIDTNIKRLTALGLEVHITEMDVKVDQGTSEKEKLAKQASIYSQTLQVCLNNPGCKSFETWGITDLYSWLGANEQPLLWDVHYDPKPAFWSIVDTLQR